MVKQLSSHLLVIAAGIFLAREIRDASASAAGAAAASKRSSAANSSAKERPRAKWRSRDYAQAWSAVRTAKLTKPERIKLQRDLLKNWAGVDLHAAIKAALDESWVAEFKQMGSSAMLVPGGPLLDAMSESLSENPEASWDVIHGGDFGEATAMLRKVWINAVGKSDPLYLAEKLEMFPQCDRLSVLAACSGTIHQRQGYRGNDEFLKILVSYPEAMVSADEIFHLATPNISTERLKEFVLNAGVNDSRMLRVYAMTFGRQIADKSATEINTEAAGMPAAVRGDILFAALTGRLGLDPGPTREQVTTLIGFLIDAGAWEKLARPEVARQIDSICRGDDAQNFAAWATSLPVRKETEVLFDRSVEPYLRNNLETSPDWIEQIPPGVWRDRAYVQYSQAAMGYHNDMAKSEWAMARISDPVLKAEAESRRAQWEILKKK